MAPLPLLVLWVNIRCTRDPNGVQVNSWQKICRDTYMFFPFNLLVGHLHCIQIFKMQLHQSVNLKARDFTGWVRRKESIKARERWSSYSSHCHSLQRETPSTTSYMGDELCLEPIRNGSKSWGRRKQTPHFREECSWWTQAYSPRVFPALLGLLWTQVVKNK